MKRTNILTIAATLSVFAATAFADRVLWYRFDGSGDTVVNAANPGFMDGKLKSIDEWKSLDGLGSSSDMFPERFSAFPDGTRLVQPNPGAVCGDEVTGLKFSGQKDDSGCVFLAKDDAGQLLALKSFTCEVFFRLPSDILDRTADRIFPIVNWGDDSNQGWKFAIWNRVENSIQSGERIVPWVRARLAKDSSGNKADNSITWRPNVVNITTNTWHHLAFVVDGKGDGSQATVKFILDYREIYSEKVESYFGFYFNPASTFPFTVGANIFRSSQACSFQGDLAELRISDRALSPDELLHPLPAGPVDEDTLFYLPLGDGAWFGHKANTNDSVDKAWVLSSAISEWQPEWRFLSIDTAEKPLLPRVVPDAPVQSCRAGISAAAGYADSASIRFTRAEIDGKLGASQHAIFVPDETNALQQDDFTLEFYFKQPTPMNSTTNQTATLVYGNWGKICINQDGGGILVRPYLEAGAVEQNKWNGSSLDVDTKNNSIRVDDGAWHHFAFVWEQATSNMVAYLDFRRIASRVVPPGLQHTKFKSGTFKGFFIGCECEQSKQGFGGFLDDVRLTRRALRPHEFLTSRMKQGAQEVLFHARFEGDYASGLGADIVADGVPRRIYGSETAGNMPELIQLDRNSKVFADERMVDPLPNSGALRISGGEVYWPHNSLLERRNITIEFFAAFEDLRAGANIIRFSPGYNPASPNPYGEPSTPIWGIFANHADGVLKEWRVVTVSCTNDAQRLLMQVQSAENKDRGRRDISVRAIPQMTDGKWHHWALTYADVGEGNTKWELWCDYEKVAEQTLSGLLYVPIYGSVLEIGGTANNVALVHGRYDEIRITDGVLPPEKFMRRGRPGFMFICR